jgi:hypothetical protein
VEIVVRKILDALIDQIMDRGVLATGALAAILRASNQPGDGDANDGLSTQLRHDIDPLIDGNKVSSCRLRSRKLHTQIVHIESFAGMRVNGMDTKNITGHVIKRAKAAAAVATHAVTPLKAASDCPIC